MAFSRHLFTEKFPLRMFDRILNMSQSCLKFHGLSKKLLKVDSCKTAPVEVVSTFYYAKNYFSCCYLEMHMFYASLQKMVVHVPSRVSWF